MDFKFKKGITDSQIKQLVKYAQTDPDVIKYTSDPKRFKEFITAKNWFKNNHVSVYTLVDQSDKLLGIVWFHQETVPERDYFESFAPNSFPLTFGIRLYEDARGKGLASGFMEKSFKDFGRSDIWLSTSADNVPGVKAYQKFGFVQVSNPDERGKIIMIFKNPPEF